jgi:integrase
MKNSIGNYHKRIEQVCETLSTADKKVIEDYIRFRRTRASEDKCHHYKVKLVILRDTAEQPFSKFNNQQLIEELLILIRDSNRAITERNELRKVLKNFLMWKFPKADVNLIKSVKLETQPMVNQEKFNPNTLPTDEEVELMFKKCKNLKEKAMLTTQDELGLRPSELLNLKWKDIKFHDDHADIKIYSSKTNGTRILVIKHALTHLLRWKNEFEYPNRREDDYVFTGKSRDKPYHRQFLGELYRKLSKLAGLNRNINPYLLRHRRITKIYDKTRDLKLTSKFGGHSLKVSEAVYQHFNEDDIKKFIMEKVYDIKEPTVQERKRIKDLEKDVEVLKKEVAFFRNYVMGKEWEKIPAGKTYVIPKYQS